MPGDGAGPQRNLPNATAVLVLGIISILGACCYGIVGLICGIIGLVLANKDMAQYRQHSAMWTTASYNNLKAGRICSIIGIVLGGLAILYFAFVAAAIFNNPEFLEEIMRNSGR